VAKLRKTGYKTSSNYFSIDVTDPESAEIEPRSLVALQLITTGALSGNDDLYISWDNYADYTYGYIDSTNSTITCELLNQSEYPQDLYLITVVPDSPLDITYLNISIYSVEMSEVNIWVVSFVEVEVPVETEIFKMTVEGTTAYIPIATVIFSSGGLVIYAVVCKFHISPFLMRA
jgi:hypothetical protein